MIQNVKFESLPTSVDEFIALRDKIASSPEGGAAVFIMALKLLNENPSVGEQCLVISIDRSKLQQGSVYKGLEVSRFDVGRINEQVKRYPYIADSYFVGANADNGYKFNLPTEIICSDNAHSGDISAGDFKVFVKSSGADSPRPIGMIRNNRGLWKAKEWSSIIMGIVPAKIEIDDDI